MKKFLFIGINFSKSKFDVTVLKTYFIHYLQFNQNGK